MIKKIDFRYLFSYMGILPYLILLIDKTFFGHIQINIINDFFIYYSLIIIVFIGAVNWSLKNKITFFQALYGVSPSFFSVVVIFLKQYHFNHIIIVLLIIFFVIFQIIFDFKCIFSFKNKKIFFWLRLPLSILICLFLIINLLKS